MVKSMKTRVRFLLPVLMVCLLPLTSCSPLDNSIPKEVELANRDLNALLDSHTDSRRAAGSAMELLIDGEQTFAAFVELIESAQDHIHLESLNFDSDDEMAEKLGLEIAEKLADKARQGVEVNVILDAVFQKLIAKPAAVEIMTAGGVNVRYFVPPPDKFLLDQVLYRTHKKILIVDGLCAVTGGSNYGSRYLGADQWRDTNLRLTGPVVAGVQREFLRDWRALGDGPADQSRYFPTLEPAGNLSIRAIDQRPAEDDFDINQAVLLAIRSAENDILLETPYFNPPDWLAEELLAAVDRGVRVRVLVNSRTSIDLTPMYWSSAIHFQDLIDHDIEVYLWDRGLRTIHSKVMVVDDAFALVTSYNFSYRSSIFDAENGMIFTDPEPVARIREVLEQDVGYDFVFRVSTPWLNLQQLEEGDLWRLTDIFGWLF